MFLHTAEGYYSFFATDETRRLVFTIIVLIVIKHLTFIFINLLVCAAAQEET